jgi:peptidoglycan/xylan/chitin deacetylase (PgdA/CDA1 family)
MTRARPVPLAWRLVGGCVLLVAFVVPVYIFIRAESPRAPGRIAAPQVAATRVPLVNVPSYRSAVPVLVYHDISDRPGRYTVSRTNFAQQMSALRLAGFHTISVGQLLAFMRGHGQLPDRPVLITFDDGLGSEWRAADPILADNGFRAVAFVISGQLGHHGSYYLKPPELDAMIRSGRWDVEAHTHMAHIYVQTDAEGDFGPALTNRQWLPQERRRETQAEFANRIRQDLGLNIAELRKHGATPQLFAYPFSAARSPTNDPRVVPVLQAIVARDFKASFVDADGGRFLDRQDGASTQGLPRIEVYDSTSDSALLERLKRLAPTDPRLRGLPSDASWQYEGAGRDAISINRNTLTLHTSPRQWAAAYLAPSGSALWHDYRVSVTFRGLGGSGSGSSETLAVANNRDQRYVISVSSTRLKVAWQPTQRPPQLLFRTTLKAVSAHGLQVMLARQRLQVALDGRTLFERIVDPSTHGGLGFGAWREKASSPIPSVANLSVVPVG